MSHSILSCLQNCVKNSPLQTIPQQVIWNFAFFLCHHPSPRRGKCAGTKYWPCEFWCLANHKFYWPCHVICWQGHTLLGSCFGITDFHFDHVESSFFFQVLRRAQEVGCFSPVKLKCLCMHLNKMSSFFLILHCGVLAAQWNLCSPAWQLWSFPSKCPLFS